jgi:hypothetical protein
MTQKFELIVKEEVIEKSHPLYLVVYETWEKDYMVWKERNGVISQDVSTLELGTSTLTFKDEQSRTNFILSFC